jgi:hypothetical protein
LVQVISSRHQQALLRDRRANDAIINGVGRPGLLVVAVALLASRALGVHADDLTAVESLTIVEASEDKLVAEVQMVHLDPKKSTVTLQLEWDDDSDLFLAMAAFRDHGKPKVSSYWESEQFEMSGHIDRKHLEVEWDQQSRTVTFTLTRMLRPPPDLCGRKCYLGLPLEANVIAYGLGPDDNAWEAAHDTYLEVSEHVTVSTD